MVSPCFFLRSTSYIILGLLSSTLSNATSVNTCTSFGLKGVDNTVVTGRTFYKAGDLVNLVNLYQGVNTTALPAFCRLELTITTNSTANSSASTEVWLPETWNSRFLAFGNGGYSGGAALSDLAFIAIVQGYAGMSTDTGHQSNVTDGSWAGPHNDNAIIDYSWRAMRLSVLAAKEVVKQYYGKTHKKSYYLSCSTGGRQGLKEVQEYPEDFDGVVLGSPANWLSNLIASVAHSILLVQPADSARFISQDIWTNVIHPEVLRQCDALDGLKDGLINDPRRCSFRPEAIACLPHQNTSTCLSSPQIDAVRKLYTDYYETNQTYIFGGWYPGGEVGMATYLFGEEPQPYALSAYRYLITNDTTWDYDQFDFSTIVLGETINPGGWDATTPNLTAFASAPHSGKIIHYFGWAENLISAGNSVHYYETVHSWMRSNHGTDMDSFYRMFPVPGMEHCLGGFGPIAFGGASQAASGMPALSNDADHDILAAMVKWVEEGEAPSTIIGTAYKENNVANGVDFTRPLCKYPAVAIYSGGDPRKASSFKCV